MMARLVRNPIRKMMTMKTTEEGRASLKKKQQADDENTRKRKEAALESGLDWCAHGSHDVVPKEEMIFCTLTLTRNRNSF